MLGPKPSIFNTKYRDLPTEEAMRQVERDGLLWEQAKALEELQNNNQQTYTTTTDTNSYSRYDFETEWRKYVPEELHSKFNELDEAYSLKENLTDIVYKETHLRTTTLITDETIVAIEKSSQKFTHILLWFCWTVISLLFTFSIADMNYPIAFSIIAIVNVLIILSYIKNVNKINMNLRRYQTQMAEYKKAEDDVIKQIKEKVAKLK